MPQAGNYVGTAQSRVDGRVKVTGAAKYAAEFSAPDLLHGVVVSSAIAKGRIKSIEAAAALAVPGVLQVFTHENRTLAACFTRKPEDDVAPPGTPFRPLCDDRIVYSGQPIALVLAEDFGLASFAASLVRVEYEAETPRTNLDLVRNDAYVPESSGTPGPRGDAPGAFAKAAVRIKNEYRVAFEHHNPMEPHASTVIYEGDGKLTIHDKSQGPQTSQRYVASVFGLSSDDVRVISPFVGGAFGAGLRPQYQLFLAVMAALELERSVRVVLTRDQMFTFSYRPDTIQMVALGSDADGILQAVMHDAIAGTSQFEDFQENVVGWSGLLYHCENARLTYKLAKIDTATPTYMRAPGAALGVFALETAMDELAYATGVDPLELRLRNYSEKDENENKPYGSKELRECYRQGAERFGWARRSPKPRSMRDGRELVGWGMASGIWEALMFPTKARAVLTADGKLEVASATADIGTGTYTILTQIGADALGLPMESVTANIGDSSLPVAPLEGGSWTAASAGSAVQAACHAVREKLFRYARELDDSPLANASLERVTCAAGRIALTSDPSRCVTFAEAMRAAGVERIEADGKAGPGSKACAHYVHSAIFAEVKVDEDLGVIRVTRIVNAVAGGRILNPKTARSQILGGVVFGMGQALAEESMLDHTLGRFMNHNIAEYHVPVHADVHDIEVIFVEEHDSANPLGVKGLGEIGIVGTAAAIGNAVYHATGVRVRELPITLDKLVLNGL